MKGVKQFLDTLDITRSIGIISGTGDRRDDDIREIGRLSAQMFDEIVICQEKYMRGRTREEIISLLTDGLKEVRPDISVVILNKGNEAFEHTMKNAPAGSLVSIISDSISNAIELVQDYQDKEMGL
jgi:cyanophycin synthetase